MGFLRVEKIGDRIALVPDEEARDLLQANAGDLLGLEKDQDGRVMLSPAGSSHENRVQRGRGFLDRYRKTFEALAK